MRSTLSLVLYLALVEVLACWLVVGPVYAFLASQSTTGYVRTLNASGASAMFAASRPAQLSAVASAAAAGGSSLAIRMVAGLGWAGLGWDTSGTTNISVVTCPLGAGCTEAFDQVLTHTKTNGSSTPSCPDGWAVLTAVTAGPTTTTITCGHLANDPASLATAVPGAVPTAQQINAWLATLPANDPLSLPSHTAPAGVGASAQGASQVVTQPVDAATVTTQVVPAAQVQPTDVVVDANAAKPAGTVTTTSTTQTTTTTTTSTVNPDGSTTQQETETAPVSCTSGTHELRTFGGILQEHLDRWTGSGLVGALNLLKTLTWPTTIPTYTLESNLLGTFTLDFSAWSGMLTALRSLIIALAGFVAYRIVFVGAR